MGSILRKAIAFSVASPFVFVVIAVVGVFLTQRSLSGGFSEDDFYMKGIYLGFTGLPEIERGPWETFVFSRGDPEYNHALINRGVLPWWTNPEARIAFFRPLATLTHWADYRYWQDNAVPMHVQNVAWYVLAAVLVAVLLRRFIRPFWVAGLAALFYVSDNAFVDPVGWVANRNALMAVCASILVLIVHDKWRRHSWRPGVVLAPALFLLGLLCGEMAVGAGGYLVAYAVFMEKGTWRDRALTIVPYLFMGVIWYIPYKLGGYGASGTAWYCDPAEDPLEFAGRVFINLPFLLTNTLFDWPYVLAGIPHFKIWAPVLCYSLIGGTVFLCWPMFKQEPVMRFFALGMVLCLFPTLSIFVQPRVTILGTVGGMALVAMYIRRWYVGVAVSDDASKVRRFAAASLAIVWILLHGVVGPVNLFAMSGLKGAVANRMFDTIASIPADEAVKDKDVVILNTQTDYTTWLMTIMRAANGVPLPKTYRMLKAGTKPGDVERRNETTLVMHAPEGFTYVENSSVYRSAKYTFLPGDTITLDGMTVRIEEVNEEGWPTRVAFEFDSPLDDPKRLFMCAMPKDLIIERIGRTMKVVRFVTVPLPAIGERVPITEILNRSPEYHENLANPEVLRRSR